MNFWKEHVVLRISLITLFALSGIALVIIGWMQTGKLGGLIVMLVGVLLLLVALAIYNIRFVTPKKKKQ